MNQEIFQVTFFWLAYYPSDFDSLFFPLLYCWCHSIFLFTTDSPFSAAFFPLQTATKDPTKTTTIMDKFVLIRMMFLDFSIMSRLNRVIAWKHVSCFCTIFLGILPLTRHKLGLHQQTWISWSILENIFLVCSPYGHHLHLFFCLLNLYFPPIHSDK